MTINELLKNNPECGDYPLYVDTVDRYVKIEDAWQSLGLTTESGPILMLKPNDELICME